ELEEFVEKNQKLVTYVAKKYFNVLDRDDCIQLGNEGLIKAINGFDEAKGYAFSTYTIPYINGVIHLYIRDKNRMIRITRRVQDNATILFRSLNKKNEEVEFLSIEEMSEISGLPIKDVVEVVESRRSMESIDFNLNQSSDDGKSMSLQEKIEDTHKEDIFNLETLDLLKSILKEIEYKTIKLRFESGFTQDQVAKILNTSQVNVCRYQSRAIKKLKEYYGVA
ncbi:MAG: sigma-70 family RNA polymerase sigma factor, partial [Bacteroidales bacterium]